MARARAARKEGPHTRSVCGCLAGEHDRAKTTGVGGGSEGQGPETELFIGYQELGLPKKAYSCGRRSAVRGTG